MELCDPRMLAALLAQAQAPPKRGARMTKKSGSQSTVYEAPARKARGRACRCGLCSRCLENARWERIFREKFADPEYYSQNRQRHESPLAHC
jgi:hypothetical protein